MPLGDEKKTLTRSYYNRWQPWPAYWVIFWSFVVLIFNGWEVFTKGNWNPGDLRAYVRSDLRSQAADFVIAYITLPIFVLLAGGYILVKKPKYTKVQDLDLFSNVPSDEEVSYTEPVPKTWFGRAVNFIFT